MKSLLRLLFFLLILTVAIVAGGAFLPGEVKIVSSSEIEARPEIIFPQINTTTNWEIWAPWMKSDSSVQVSYGNTKGQGASLELHGELLGNCKIEITHSVENESVAAKFLYEDGSVPVMTWFIEPLENSSLVYWTISFSNLSLWEKYFAKLFKKRIKGIIGTGLKNLKTIAEGLKYSRLGEIDLVELQAQPAVLLKANANLDTYRDKIPEMDNYLDRFMERRELPKIGKPFTIINEQATAVDSSLIRGFRLTERTWVWRTLEYFVLPEGRALSISHFGSETPRKAYEALEAHVQTKGLQKNGLPWQEELFDSKVDIDSTLWEVKVYLPIK